MENLVNNLEVYLNASIFMSLTASFVGGLLTSFTPCVYPMIPITAGYVSSNNIGGSKIKGFWLSVCYVLGVATTLCILRHDCRSIRKSFDLCGQKYKMN